MGDEPRPFRAIAAPKNPAFDWPSKVAGAFGFGSGALSLATFAGDGAAGAGAGVGVVGIAPGSGGALGPIFPWLSMWEPELAALKALRLASKVPSARALAMLAARGDMGAEAAAVKPLDDIRESNWSGASPRFRTPPTRTGARDEREPDAAARKAMLPGSGEFFGSQTKTPRGSDLLGA